MHPRIRRPMQKDVTEWAPQQSGLGFPAQVFGFCKGPLTTRLSIGCTLVPPEAKEIHYQVFRPLHQDFNFEGAAAWVLGL